MRRAVDSSQTSDELVNACGASLPISQWMRDEFGLNHLHVDNVSATLFRVPNDETLAHGNCMVYCFAGVLAAWYDMLFESVRERAAGCNRLAAHTARLFI